MAKNKIFEYLKECKIRQTTVADAIAVSLPTANKQINGKSEFTRSEIQLLHNKLRIPLEVFFE